MMLKKVIGIILLFMVHSALFMACYAESTSSMNLINNAKEYDNKIVVYSGEVIGDVMVRGEYAWINLHDGKRALGIWLPASLVKGIIYTGSYKTRGDWVEITGIFHRACPEHGGDLDIHAERLRKIQAGGDIQEKLDLDKRKLIMILAGVLFLTWILTLLKRR